MYKQGKIIRKTRYNIMTVTLDGSIRGKGVGFGRKLFA